jgi:hypothetical protein
MAELSFFSGAMNRELVLAGGRDRRVAGKNLT